MKKFASLIALAFLSIATAFSQVNNPPTGHGTGTSVQQSDGTGTSALTYFDANGNTTATPMSAANCLAATTVEHPCIALTSQASGLGTAGTSGTLTLYTSNAPNNGKFLVCPGTYITTAGTAGSIATTAVAWTTPGNLNLAGFGLFSLGLTSGPAINSQCIVLATKSGTSLSLSVAASGATGSPSWEYNLVVVRLF